MEAKSPFQVAKVRQRVNRSIVYSSISLESAERGNGRNCEFGIQFANGLANQRKFGLYGRTMVSSVYVLHRKWKI